MLDQTRSAALVLVLTSAAFELTGPLPPHVKHVGPRLDDILDSGDWEPPPGDEPLVLLALSSDFQDQEDVLRRAMSAIAALPLRGIATTGHGIDPDSLEPPPNVEVRRLAPHSKILSEATAVITHGGHGTTMKALAAGVPLVCLPMGRDQLDIAARIVHRGVSLRLDPAADSDQSAAALREVLASPSYRRQARRIASAITEETAEDRAAAEIEALVERSTRAPTTTPTTAATWT